MCGLITPMAVHAAPGDVLDKSCTQAGSSGSDFCEGRDQKLFGPNSIFTKIINTLIFVIGAIAVIMIIIGGLRYTLSGGDAGSVTSAKNTILYAIVGLIIAILSYAIVNFVISSF